VETCAGLGAGEKALVLCNPETREVAEHVAAACRVRTPVVRLEVLEPLAIHGAAPPPQVGLLMLWADVVFCLTRMSLAHTAERFEATRKGTRFLSLPDYSLDVLAGKSLTFDFHRAVPVARRLGALLDDAHAIRVRTQQGTDLTFSAATRRANACPGLCLEPGTLGSPPDAEVNVAPLEGTAEGLLVVDGSIPCAELGLLTAPLTLQLKAGRVTEISGSAQAADMLQRLFDRAGKPETRWLAEFGIGLNPLATLSGHMLEDEGCAGTVHFGFGSNATIGGTIRVPFHLDFVVKDATVAADGKIILDRSPEIP
jgi:leucyl aminopeptidase (aminopeptidase T)